MLPKKNRLDRKAIEVIFKQNNFINSSNLTFRFLKDFSIKETRTSFVVPKSICKKAVIRNLLRRRGYSCFAKVVEPKVKPFFNFQGLTLGSSFWGVFIFKKGGVEIFSKKRKERTDSIQKLESEIKLILSKLY
jgi:ribonuclease P protein component